MYDPARIDPVTRAPLTHALGVPLRAPKRMSKPALAIWSVGAYERPIRGRVNHERYAVLAGSAEEAIAAARAEHEHAALPETEGTRYVASATGRITKTSTMHSMTAKGAEEAISAGLP